MSVVSDLLDTLEETMMESIAAFERDVAGMRTGKASPSLVENLMVEYYGTQTRLRDIAGITTPEPRLLVIQPWDKSALSAIEKAILTSNLGISPMNDGRVVRLPVPELSEERRKDLCKQVKRRAEDGKVALRSERREANENAKKVEKDKKITQDDLTLLLEGIQKLTDDYCDQIDRLAEKKVQEVMVI